MADNENTPPAADALQAKPLKPCVQCGKPAVARYKPFCSARCADIDLGRWLKGSYVIPGEPVDEAETGLPPSERDEDR
ncbi:MAG: DNA gyrase inhibitor YacG [Bosea sp. (in: a-proteobacteria)]|uniref:DNA gyrase inhibitor YacG n=1 Tax=Bosea sp. (in: a-proteobacteria) TaxID=1871050 RepID=UPI002735F17B|nr:DNA gyrase inhibitor YacG [Bosea sp. (in: a-proteobacteria)]MDP3254444.1 DNA gyrase inhibitor YacG [Bosea sp. (in: a-proteobacteria)]MDP3319983.1 DNA gyrase inhibitor YacG [Bosea sp. (in: a-proteobacteria)]